MKIHLRKIIPHTVIITFVILFILFGLFTNNGQIGRAIGMSAAFFLDPAILLTGAIAGFSKSYKNLLTNGFLLSIVMIFIVYYNVSQWHEIIGVSHDFGMQVYLYSIRIMDLFIIAHLVNIPVVILPAKNK